MTSTPIDFLIESLIVLQFTIDSVQADMTNGQPIMTINQDSPEY